MILSNIFNDRYNYNDGKLLSIKTGKEIAKSKVDYKGHIRKGVCTVNQEHFFSDFIVYSMFNKMSKKASIVHLDDDITNNDINNLMLEKDFNKLSLQDKLNIKLNYDNGILTVKSTGKEIGKKEWNGSERVTVNILGVSLQRYNASYIMHNGKIPKGKVIDHENRIQDDDRLENNRLASGSDNQCNRVFKGNRTGYTGIKEKILKDGTSRFEASIKKFGKYKYLGTYDNIDEAVSVRNKACKELHGAFARPCKQ